MFFKPGFFSGMNPATKAKLQAILDSPGAEMLVAAGENADLQHRHRLILELREVQESAEVRGRELQAAVSKARNASTAARDRANAAADRHQECVEESNTHTTTTHLRVEAIKRELEASSDPRIEELAAWIRSAREQMKFTGMSGTLKADSAASLMASMQDALLKLGAMRYQGWSRTQLTGHMRELVATLAPALSGQIAFSGMPEITEFEVSFGSSSRPNADAAMDFSHLARLG